MEVLNRRLQNLCMLLPDRTKCLHIYQAIPFSEFLIFVVDNFAAPFRKKSLLSYNQTPRLRFVCNLSFVCHYSELFRSFPQR